MDPEVEEQLAQETTVVRAFGEHGTKVRPLCGYGLLQAKEEARRVQALRSLMRVRTKPSSTVVSGITQCLNRFSFSIALCVPAVISDAGADGELPGRCRAEPGQAAALLGQNPPSRNTHGREEPHVTQRVRSHTHSQKMLYFISNKLSHVFNVSEYV